jgi:ABC-2 type transport system ATP-binding protein
MPPAVTPTTDWLAWETAGTLTRFIETRYAGEATEHGWREKFAGAAATAQPMTLREIFIILARAARTRDREAAA